MVQHAPAAGEAAVIAVLVAIHRDAVRSSVCAAEHGGVLVGGVVVVGGAFRGADVGAGGSAVGEEDRDGGFLVQEVFQT